MKIYLAGPVVTKDMTILAQIGRIENALNWMRGPENEFTLEEDKIEVYRPGKHKVPNAWGIDMKTWAQCVFTMDVAAIDECDWMVVADYGRQATAGTSWECGYAFAKGIKILVIVMPGVEESSLMTHGCAANICNYWEFVDCGGDEDRANEERFSKFFYERGCKQQEGDILN